MVLRILKGFLALFRNITNVGRSRSFFPARLQPLQLGNRMVKLPVKQCFIPHQFVELFV